MQVSKSMLRTVLSAYPKDYSADNCAVSGLIPIDVFLSIEKELRPEMRKEKLRAIYRGPRRYAGQSMTRKGDAKNVLLYFTG